MSHRYNAYYIFSGYAWLTLPYHSIIKINGLKIKIEHRVYQGKILMSGIIEYRLFVQRDDTVKADIQFIQKDGTGQAGPSSKPSHLNRKELEDVEECLTDINESGLTRGAIKHVGKHLYRTLFYDAIKSHFEEHAVRVTLKGQFQRCHIRIIFPEYKLAKENRLAKIISQPWELLWYPDDDIYLGTHIQLFFYWKDKSNIFVELTFFPQSINEQNYSLENFMVWLKPILVSLNTSTYYVRYENASWVYGDTSQSSGVIFSNTEYPING